MRGPSRVRSGVKCQGKSVARHPYPSVAGEYVLVASTASAAGTATCLCNLGLNINSHKHTLTGHVLVVCYKLKSIQNFLKNIHSFFLYFQFNFYILKHVVK